MRLRHIAMRLITKTYDCCAFVDAIDGVNYKTDTIKKSSLDGAKRKCWTTINCKKHLAIGFDDRETLFIEAREYEPCIIELIVDPQGSGVSVSTSYDCEEERERMSGALSQIMGDVPPYLLIDGVPHVLNAGWIIARLFVGYKIEILKLRSNMPFAGRWEPEYVSTRSQAKIIYTRDETIYVRKMAVIEKGDELNMVIGWD